MSGLTTEIRGAVEEMIRQLHEERYYGPYRLDYVNSFGEARSVLVRDDGSIEELKGRTGGGPGQRRNE